MRKTSLMPATLMSVNWFSVYKFIFYTATLYRGTKKNSNTLQHKVLITTVLGIHLCWFTTGPLPNTTVDFWRMVWQERSQTIVMVTNLVEGNRIKCHKYWPETGTLSFGPFNVTITGQQILADYTTRHFAVQVKYTTEWGHVQLPSVLLYTIYTFPCSSQRALKIF